MPARFALRAFSFEVLMPVPSSIASLSTTASANPPAGNTPALPEMDDHIRQAYAFIRSVSDSVGGKLDASAVSAFMLTVLNDADAAAARATLGAASRGANTFTGAQTLPGDAANPLEAVPKQQLDSRTLLASGAEAVAGTDASKLLTPSTLRSGLNSSGAAPVFAARAWVNFDASSGTPVIRGSGNVSGVTRNGPGDYTITFSSPMPDANYTITATTSRESYNLAVAYLANTQTFSTTAVQVFTVGVSGTNNTPMDPSRVMVSIFR